MTPKISVIMSVKNGENVLERSIKSIQSQTMNDWELIVCDDGSTDNTLSVLTQYALRDPRIVVLHNDYSHGSAYGRNVCIEKSRTNFLAIHDADDSSHPERFEKQYKFMQENPEYAIVGTAHYNIFPNGSKVMVIHEEHPDALCQVKGGAFMHPSFMMRKDQIAKVGFYTANKYTWRSQDYHMVMKVLGEGMKMYNMPEPLYNYTVEDGVKLRSRSWKRVPGLMWIRWDAYRRNHLPIWCYIYVFKPVITNLIPKKVMMKYYDKIYGGRKNAQAK